MCLSRAVRIEPVGLNVPVAGIAALRRGEDALGVEGAAGAAAVLPPTMRTRPSAAAWPCGGIVLAERTRRAEGRRGRVPGLRRGEGAVAKATDDEDATIGQEGGRLEPARLGKGAGRAEGAGRRVPGLRRSEEVARGRVAPDDEDAAVGQERGGVVLARLVDRACRAEGSARGSQTSAGRGEG